MLHLKSATQTRWLQQADANLEAILIDHAHCEHKAAATAMSFLGGSIFTYDKIFALENAGLSRTSTKIGDG